MTDISEFVKANKISGAIFDMDGTLADSMGRWGEIYAELSRYLNIELPQDFMMRVNHLPMSKRVGVIINEFGLDADKSEVYAFWIKCASRYYDSEFKVKPFMLDTVKRLKALGVKMAIATASDGALAQTFIKSNDLTQYISSITSLDEVDRPKSFPDIYLLAAKKLGIEPSKCIVFEDALTAIKAAKSGGFMVCGVSDYSSKRDERQIKCLSDFILGF